MDKGRRGFHEGWGNGVKYLKREWNKRRRAETKNLNKEGKLGQEVGVVNEWGGGGAGTPLRTITKFEVKRSEMKLVEGALWGKLFQVKGGL